MDGPGAAVYAPSFRQAMKLLDYLQDAAIDLDLHAGSKQDVLGQLVDVLARTQGLQQRDTLLETLLEREGLGSTGIGQGVAIPHGRSPEVEHPVLALGRTDAPVEFDAIDGKPARIFFLLVAPENGSNEHLHLLARIARLMNHADTREHLLAAGSREEVMALLRECDAA